MDLGASSGTEGRKNVLQLLKEQNEKWRGWRGLSATYNRVCWETTLATLRAVWIRPLRCWAECSTPISASLKAGWKSKRDWNPTPPRKGWGSSEDHVRRLWEIYQKTRLRVKTGQPVTLVCSGGKEPSPGWKRGLASGHEKEQKEKKQRKAKDPVQKAQGTVTKPKLKRSTPARSGDAIKVSAKDDQFYTVILRELKAKVDPRRVELEVLSIRKTRKEEVLLILKKGGDGRNFGPGLDEVPLS